jgi:hypothetical protein
VKLPQPVELILGVIFRDPGLLEPLEARLARGLGRIELRSDLYDFDVTDYYAEEMGSALKRIFYSFTDMISPDTIVDVKRTTDGIEGEFARDGKRRVNLDPGYMDFYKLVLASNKYLGQKVYLGKGVYADPTLYYDRGWKPYDWGFPDFKDGRYDAFLTEVRRRYKAKLGGRGGQPAGRFDGARQG